jgi:tetratricopeptide (TPR) repeat protein
MSKVDLVVDTSSVNLNYSIDNMIKKNVEFEDILENYDDIIENDDDIFLNNKKNCLNHIISIADVSNETRAVMFDLFNKEQYDDAMDLLKIVIQFDFKQIKNLHNKGLYYSFLNNFIESNNIARKITIILIDDEVALDINHIKYFIRLGETDVDLERYEDALKSLNNAGVVLNRIFYILYQNNNQISDKDSFIYDINYINYKKEIDELIKKSKSCIGIELVNSFQISIRPKSKLYLKKNIIQCISKLSLSNPSSPLPSGLLPPHSHIVPAYNNSNDSSSPIDKVSSATSSPNSTFYNAMQSPINSPKSGFNSPKSGFSTPKSSFYSPVTSKVTSRTSSPSPSRPNTPLPPVNTQTSRSPIKRLLKELSDRFSININSTNIDDDSNEDLSEEDKILLEEAENKLKLISQQIGSMRLSIRKSTVLPIEVDPQSVDKIEEMPKELIKAEIIRRNYTFFKLSKPRNKRPPSNQILERVALLKAKSKKSINF